LHFSFWRKTLSASENNTQVLFVAALSGAVLAIVLPVGQRVLSARQSLVAFGRGVKGGMTAVAVLLLAWALAAVCKDLGAGPVLIAAVGKSLPTVLVPVVTFGVAAAVAFATGTSWGTMAILIPTAVPLAHATGSEPLTLLTMASVLDGAIFGDHCSPISDTTLMSSIAAGSDHVDHVATQLPYAVTAMLAAMFGGYLPVAFGWPPAAAYAMGIAMVALAVFGLGRKVRP
jgi:Na+/H+ antiporter NhaC